MAVKTKLPRKDFDAVAFMRKQRDRISRDIADMSFEQIRRYFDRRSRTTKAPERKKNKVTI